MTSPAIPPDRWPEILVRLGKGNSTREVSRWLREECGVEVSYKTIAVHAARERHARADIAKVVLREHLSKTVISDIDHIEGIRAEVAERARKVDPEDHRNYAALKTLELKALDRKLHYSGADAEDPAKDSGISPAEARRRLRDILGDVGPHGGSAVTGNGGDEASATPGAAGEGKPSG